MSSTCCNMPRLHRAAHYSMLELCCSITLYHCLAPSIARTRNENYYFAITTGPKPNPQGILPSSIHMPVSKLIKPVSIITKVGVVSGYAYFTQADVPN